MLVKRNNFNMLSMQLSKPEIVIILGARQVGKTTLMRELIRFAKNQNLNIRSFNLELPDDLLFFSKTTKELFDDFSKIQNTLIFIDEFHYLSNASKLFKALYDCKKNIKIFASGSSSMEIHKHLKESLAGRRSVIPIYPLSLEEWNQTGKPFIDYLTYGALPGLIHQASAQDKVEYLNQMSQAYILKDIKGLIKEENIRAFNHLLYYLAEHQGNILPTANLASEVSLNAKSVEKYLEIMEQTFTLHSVSSYANKLANELKKSKKYYLYDLGIRNHFLKDFRPPQERPDEGAILESLVLLELKKLQKSNIDIRFWRTKQGDEVDFIWIENRLPIPIEVKSTTDNDRIPSGIIKFLKHYPQAPKAFVFNYDRNDELIHDGRTIFYRTFNEVSKSFSLNL